MKENVYERKVITLKNGLKQEYFLDSSIYIPLTRDGKIFVNEKRFNKLKLNEQRAIIYHERGHLKKTNILFLELSNYFFILLLIGIIFMIEALFLLIIYILSKCFPLMIIFFLGISFFLVGFLGVLTFRWMSEIMCDFNAVKNMGKSSIINALKKAYENKKFELWRDLVAHPPHKLRISIIKELD